MGDAIGPDGLTDGERAWVATYGWRRPLSQLAAERLAHAETRAKHAEWSVNKERRHAEEKMLERARAEKAEAERDRLRAALTQMVDAIGPLESHSAASVLEDSDVIKANRTAIAARALLGEVKP